MTALTSAEVVVDREGRAPTVRVVRGDRTMFEHRFAGPQQICDAQESPSGNYLLVWHCDRPPRKLKIFRLTDGALLADFAPGYGGDLRWTLGDKVLHSWGSGTGCQNIRVYDVAGGLLHHESVTGHVLTSRGYFVTFPTLSVARDLRIRKFDVNLGRDIVLVEESPGPLVHARWEEGRLFYECAGSDQQFEIETE